MKIGIYDPYLDDTGGGEKYMMTLAEVLSPVHEVSVFWNNAEDLEKVRRRFSLNLEHVKLTKNIFTPSFSIWKRLKESKKFDTIIILSDGSIPLVQSKLYIHFQRPLEQVHPSVLSRLKLKRVQAVFCNSKFTKSYIDKTFHVNSLVLYPPVNLSPKTERRENIILHVGRFRVFDKTVGAGDFKKQHIMIKVFKEMVDQGLSGWKFVLAVSVKDEDKESFQNMKKETEGYPIEFELNRSNDSLWELYSKAKIYWHASGYGENLQKNPELAEHFGISTVEAMGAGATPVVISAGGQKEIVTDGVDGFTWSTLPELKEKTMTLIDSPKLLIELSKNAKNRAEDFSKEMFEKKVRQMVG